MRQEHFRTSIVEASLGDIMNTGEAISGANWLKNDEVLFSSYVKLIARQNFLTLIRSRSCEVKLKQAKTFKNLLNSLLTCKEHSIVEIR